jgi:hypothetical protein
LWGRSERSCTPTQERPSHGPVVLLGGSDQCTPWHQAASVSAGREPPSSTHTASGGPSQRCSGAGGSSVACLDRLGARPRLAGRRPGGLPDRVRAPPATGGPRPAGTAGHLPRRHHRLRHRLRRAARMLAVLPRPHGPGPGRLGGRAGPDPAAAGRVRTPFIAGGHHPVAGPMASRSPASDRRDGLLRPCRHRHRRLSHPTTSRDNHGRSQVR